MTPKKILIADDEADICEMLSLVLKKHGFESRTVGDADAAIAAVASYQPDCIVSDIRMPRGGGMRLLEELQKLPQNTRPPVLLITGFADIDSEEAKRRGAIDIMQKPLKLHELVRKVTEIIGP